MQSKVLETAQPVPGNLKRKFENAVRDIYEAGLPGKSSRQRMPIFQRSVTAADGGINAEKRALADAAKALAQLWKISASSR